MDLITEIKSLLSTYFKPAERLKPSLWVQKYIRLTKRQSLHTGLYSLKRTPYFAEIYDAIINPHIRQVGLMKSAQIGYSQFVSNLCFYLICTKTNPIAIVFPNKLMAQQWSERCLHAGLDSCEPLSEVLTGSADDLKKTDLTFKSCNLKIIGGGSSTNLSSNPVCYLFLDEVDKYEDFQLESNVVELAIDRTITYHETGEAKIFMGSTPNLAGISTIEKKYKEGSQSKYHVPCPHCGHFQELTFSKETVCFDNCKGEDGEWDLIKVQRDTYYKCIKCHKAITEDKKLDMLNGGHWVVTNPTAPHDYKSYHISALYSLSKTWGAVAREFLAAKDDRSALQNFYNSTLGLPWVAEASTVTDDAMDALIKDSPEYYRGEIPSKPKALIIGVDVQATELYWLVMAVLEDGRKAVVDYGQVVGFEDLDIVAQRKWRVRGTTDEYECYGGFIDAGYRSTEVYRYCKDSYGFFIPAFGKTKAHGLHTAIRRADVPTDFGYITVCHINDHSFSYDILTEALNPKHRKRILLPADTEQYLKYQLTAVAMVKKKDASGREQIELKAKRNNHWFDTLKLCKSYYYCIRATLDTEEAPEPTPAAVEPEPVLSEPVLYHDQGW